MKNLKFFAIVIAFLAISTSSYAQYEVGATIFSPLTIANPTPLNFGGMISGATAGTVVFNPSTSVRTPSGGVSLPAGLAASPTVAIFNVTGEKGKGYTITLPTAPVTITKSGGGTMTVTAFTSSKGLSSTLDASSGTDSFNVGATLNVGANQAVGVYTGTYTVQVIYQ